MGVQGLVVAVLVPACAAYAAWALMPAAARRALARQLLRLVGPAGRVAAVLERAAKPDAACGCSGCDRAAPAAREQPLHFRPRSKKT